MLVLVFMYVQNQTRPTKRRRRMWSRERGGEWSKGTCTTSPIYASTAKAVRN